MNNKKICFIVDSKDTKYSSESIHYISNLFLPKGYEIDVLLLENSNNIATEYNNIIKYNDSKYKIYLQKDVFIINKNFILDILTIFNSDEGIGIIGVNGSEVIKSTLNLDDNNIRYGKLYKREDGYINLVDYKEITDDYKEVSLIDRCIVATQIDVEFKEDIICTGEFINVIQCIEFSKIRKKIVVAKQLEPWVLQDSEKLSGEIDNIEKENIITQYCNYKFPLVSILIPVNSYSVFFELALNDMIEQSYANIEIIIGDNSKDDNIENIVVEKYLKKYKKIKYYNNKNILSEADNKIYLANKSQGKYINFIDIDGRYDREIIELMINTFIEDIDNKVGLVILKEPKDETINKEIPANKNIKKLEGTELVKYILNDIESFKIKTKTILFNREKMEESFGYYEGQRFESNVELASWCQVLKSSEGIILESYYDKDISYVGKYRKKIEKDLAKQLIGCLNIIRSCRRNGILDSELEYIQLLYLYLQRVIRTSYDDDAKDIISKLQSEFEIVRKKLPLVSVLIPTYNRPEYLKIALDSVIEQTYPNIEVIIGDDSTNELTKEFIKTYLNKYKNIKYIYNNGPLGKFGQNNLINLLNESSGEYINILMDDDIFKKNKISTMINYYLNDDTIALVTSYRQSVDENGNFINDNIATNPIVDKDTVFSGYEIGRTLIETANNFIGEPTTALVRRKDVMGSFGTYNNKSYETLIDIAQWLECCKKGKVVYIKDALSYFRCHEGQNQKNQLVIVGCLLDEYEYLNSAFENFDFNINKEKYTELIKKWGSKSINFINGYSSEINGRYLRLLKCIKRSNSGLLYKCNICSNKIGKFIPYRGAQESVSVKSFKIIGSDIVNFQCPRCGSIDRVRHLFVFLDKLGIFKKINGSKILHIAAESHLYYKIESLNPEEYIVGDLYPEQSQIKAIRIDITNINYIDNYFDFIICNHVLEHIPDDSKAISEVYRVLKPGGIAIMQTPYSEDIDMSYEREEINTDELRLLYYGQEDHVRIYGLNLFTKFEEVGFKLDIIRSKEVLSDEVACRYGMNIKEPFILLRK